MARHNREGAGADQRGVEYRVNYQPDWLKLGKVTRQLESGRQSTKTLFRNPAAGPEAEPGDRIRTRIVSADQTLDFPDKLMAGMEAARRAGGDGRCSCNLNSPQSCGCPPRSFVKSGHIGCMVVARVGDTDDTVCSKNGCADGDYFMTLNVKFQGRDDPDPVFQLRDQFTAWRNAHRDVPDAVHSTAKLSFDRLPSDGVSQSTLAIRLRDFRNRLVAVAPGSLTVSHAPNSAGISTLGPLVDNGNGVFFVTITAGVGSGAAEAVSGTDLFRITIADGSRPVILMPEPELTFCDPGPNCLPPPVCGDNVVNQTSEVCDGTDDAACPGACQTNCTCPPAEICGDNVVNQASEVCDGSDDAACPGACRSDCTCPSSASCGDGVVNQGGEVCDGADDTACPGACQPDCTCPASPPPAVPTASTWGLVAMTLLLLGGARVLFGRRQGRDALKQ